MNLYTYLADATQRSPGRVAVAAPVSGADPAASEHEQITFGELHSAAGRIAAGLAGLGVGRGDRVVLMVPVSVDLYRVVAALFRLGAVPVLMDPWMGVAKMAACVRHTEARAFIGVPLAHALLSWRPGLGGLTRILVGGASWLPGHRLERMLARSPDGVPVADLGADDPALITFTGGTTGRPKGVFRSHGVLDAQHRGTMRCMGVVDGAVHMQAFPNMVMSNIAVGATSVIPRFRQGHVAEADPAALARQVRRFDVTGICGPPALLARLADHCIEHETPLGQVRRIVVGGSAVGFDVVRRLEQATRPGAAVVLYGSSEAEPLATLRGSREFRHARRALREGGGLCVGRPPDGLDLEIIAVPRHDGPLEVDEAGLRALRLPPGRIGDMNPPPARSPVYNPGDGRRPPIFYRVDPRRGRCRGAGRCRASTRPGAATGAGRGGGAVRRPWGRLGWDGGGRDPRWAGCPRRGAPPGDGRRVAVVADGGPGALPR
ncbi:MAG: AMP-binding protein, partial [Myxococcota bacterium]|nr:AMP-binding protein [Myxococcota bacterium]